MTSTTCDRPSDIISDQDARELFDSASQKWFGVSGRAFARAWRCGLISHHDAKGRFVDNLRRLAGQ